MLSFRGFQAAGFLLSPAFFSLLLFLKASVVNGYVHGGFEAGGLDGKGRQVPWGEVNHILGSCAGILCICCLLVCPGN